LFHSFSGSVKGILDAAIEDRMQDFLFAFEVKVDSAIGHTGFTRNVSDLGVEIAAAREDTDRGAQNGFSFVRYRESFIGRCQ
jgi:hypothetical protein